MKISILSVTLMLLGILTAAFAEPTVDEQIASIQDAAPKDRVRLMNEFKKRLSELSSQEREDAIVKLRSRIQTRTRERSRINQMNETEYTKREQYMHQHQVANQAINQGVSGDSGTANRFMGKK